MNFKQFLHENLAEPIDDNDVLNTFSNNDISYTRIKMDNGKLLYSFDNRYSIIYDGSLFKLYRQGNKVHMGNARNLKEIESTIMAWTESYSLATPDQTVTDDEIDQFIDRLKDQNGGESKSEPETSESGEESDSENKDKEETTDKKEKDKKDEI